MRSRTHEDTPEVLEQRVRKVLREEVADVEVSANEVHAQLVLTNMITNFEVADIKMTSGLSRRDRVVMSRLYFSWVFSCFRDPTKRCRKTKRSGTNGAEHE